jgi:MOSC domain-containing protein YiiM
MSGRVHAINVSDGGVPKLPRDAARIRATGVEGDRQRNLRFHGGPDRAVCLYSADLIRALNDEGHPIAPGTIGENLTIEGLDWASLRRGVTIEAGEAVLEITSTASPCHNIAASFAHGKFTRVSQKIHPGWSRWYARVLREGAVRVGDAVRLLQTPREEV